MNTQKSLDSIKQDPVYVKYKNVLRLVKNGSDLVKIREEADFLHKKKLSRKLHEMRIAPAALQDAVANDLSNRARMVELKAFVLNQLELLSSTLSLTKKHLRVEYRDVFSAFGKTRDMQTLLLDKILSSGNEVLSQLESTNTLLDVYIKDIDQSGYAMSTIKETLILFLKAKEVV